MPIIELDIHSPIDRVFDLSRSIDLHMLSTDQTQEQAIAGCTSGLIEFGEEVTWRARHFGVWQQLTSRITAYDRPFHFRDSMVHGIFKRIDHDHHFSERDGVTHVSDLFSFDAPYGLLGDIANHMFLIRYMGRFLMRRNSIIKDVAESTSWQKYISEI